MIVCHCKAVSDRRIHAEAALGADTVDALALRCGAGSDCGRCVPRVEQVLRIRRAQPLTAAS